MKNTGFTLLHLTPFLTKIGKKTADSVIKISFYSTERRNHGIKDGTLGMGKGQRGKQIFMPLGCIEGSKFIE
jgi:hypothetical protein